MFTAKVRDRYSEGRAGAPAAAGAAAGGTERAGRTCPGRALLVGMDIGAATLENCV